VQTRILRAVEGAVRNAAHAHHRAISVSFARSIAKRAAGTISAQMPELLAVASRPSEKAESDTPATDRPRRACGSAKRAEKGPAQVRSSRAHLRNTWKHLTQQIKPLRLADNDVLANSYVEILKAISAAQRVYNDQA
jgi:hypothetical protein